MTDILDAVTKERIKRGGLLAFVQEFWDVLESVPLILEPHMELICAHVQANMLFAAGNLQKERQPWMDGAAPLQNLVIACPPGVSKTATVMNMAPAWAWTWCPSMKLGCTSYSESLAFRDAKRSFDLIFSEKYQKMWPIEIDGGERASMTYYVNNKKGSRTSVQMGAGVTGRHFHWLAADDPAKPQG